MSKRAIFLLVFTSIWGIFLCGTSFCMETTVDENVKHLEGVVAQIDEELKKNKHNPKEDEKNKKKGATGDSQSEDSKNAILQAVVKALSEQDRRDGYHNRWHKEDEIAGKDFAKKICIKNISEQIFGPNGEKLHTAFKDGVLEGLWPTIQGVSAVAATSGFIEATDAAVAKVGNRLFNAIGSQLSGAWEGLKRYVFHSGANQLNGYDLSRWGSVVKNMIEGLIEIADRVKTSARIGSDIGLLHLNEFQKNGDDATAEGAAAEEAPAQKVVVDKNWQEISRGYLARIIQMVVEIEFRQRYYGRAEKSEVSFCLERLKVALIGDGASMIVDEHGNMRPGGGVYARIAQAKSLVDLASTQTVTTLELFKKHIIGLLGELGIWVKAKRGEEHKKNPYSNGGTFDLDY